jgi:hypothetical protein
VFSEVIESLSVETGYCVPSLLIRCATVVVMIIKSARTLFSKVLPVIKPRLHSNRIFAFHFVSENRRN